MTRPLTFAERQVLIIDELLNDDVGIFLSLGGGVRLQTRTGSPEGGYWFPSLEIGYGWLLGEHGHLPNLKMFTQEKEVSASLPK